MNLPKILTLITVILAAIAFYLSITFYFIQQKSRLSFITQVQDTALLSDVNTTALYKKAEVRSGFPVRLKIPAINVDAPIEYVGLTPQGAMDVPKTPDSVAWLQIGQRPGENGSAVIAGHYGWWKSGSESVFDNLYKLRKGDKLFIEDDKGVIVSFVVRESRRYDPSADASAVFGSNDGKAHLNLITCEGVWVGILKTYSKRLVVFTDKE